MQIVVVVMVVVVLVVVVVVVVVVVLVFLQCTWTHPCSFVHHVANKTTEECRHYISFLDYIVTKKN
jgi:hypothetical protein